jgi:DNA-binding transcriptional regulator YiaG
MRFSGRRRASAASPPISGRGTADQTEEDVASSNARRVLDQLAACPSRPELIQILTREFGLADEELARLSGFSRDAVARWDEKDNPAAERLDDLGDIAALLIRSANVPPGLVAGWLRSRNRSLGWQRPLDVLRLEGYLHLAEAVDALLVK